MLMKKEEDVDSILREWKAPAPSADLDDSVLQAFRKACPAPVWRRVPPRLERRVLLIAATVLVAVGLSISFRPIKGPPEIPQVVTRINASGFRALPDGAATIIKAREVRN